jgi:hypothetical protein
LLVRPFSVRDILLVRELQDKGISLDLERSVLQPRVPLWNALLSQVPLNSSGAATYVTRNKNLSGFVQALPGRGPTEVYLAYLAPALTSNDDVLDTWQELLETLCRSQGERGVQRIFVKLPAEAEAEADVFRKVGFRVYTQEHVFRLPQPAANGISAGPIRLRPWESRDMWGVHRLYCLGAPRFVQQAEYLPGEISEAATSDWAHGKHEERHVWAQNHEITAYLRLLSGERGHWLHLLMHPDHTEHADALISLGVARLAKYAPRPVFCAVRTYETDLTWALKAVGFREYQIRFLLVKQTTVRIRQKAFEPLPQVEGAEAAPTASVRVTHIHRQEEPTPLHPKVLRETQ